MRSLPLEYFGDTIADAGAPQQIIVAEAEKNRFRLFECLQVTYVNSVGGTTYRALIVDLDYEYAGGGPARRIKLQRCPGNKNSMIPLINGLSDEDQGRALAGRLPVLVNPNDRLVIFISGGVAGDVYFVRGRYWEADSAEELLGYYIGLNALSPGQ